MLTTERRARILRRLALDGRVVDGETARELGVSLDTARRDIRELDRAAPRPSPRSPASAPTPACSARAASTPARA